MTHSERKLLINKLDNEISVIRQAELLGISRSNYYYVPAVNHYELELKACVDLIYTDLPFYGCRRVADELRDRFELVHDKDYVNRLMREMGLEAIYPKSKRKTSIPGEVHPDYPYLLKELQIIRPNQVWGTDITYLAIQNGFAYLVAIIDWYSRYVVAWLVSTSLDTSFCLENLQNALRVGHPEIHNSDWGCQFTSSTYLNTLMSENIKISLDGRGRCMDNIFTERLWRTVKYENIYLMQYETVSELKIGLEKYFQFYNHHRRHSSLDKQTPAEVYFK